SGRGARGMAAQPCRAGAVGAHGSRRDRPRREFRARGPAARNLARRDRDRDPPHHRTGSAAVSEPSWSERLFGGFRKTSEKLAENLTGVVGTAKLDDATLDELEDALILSDLGPSAAARIRAKLAEKRFGLSIGERELKEAVAEEIAAILRPVAKPLEITAFPRPQVILVIGVNGSGKTTTIAKLAHLFQEDDYGVLLAAGDTFRAAAIGQLAVWAERIGVEVVRGPEGGDPASIVFDAVK